jgi:hypothetical protein
VEKLRDQTMRDLYQMNQAMGGPEPADDLTEAQLVQHVHAVARTKTLILETVNATGRDGGICGVALAGDVPIRSVVSRGVTSLTSRYMGGDGTPQPETGFFVQEAERFRPGDESYMFSGDHAPEYHLIRKVKDVFNDKVYTANAMLSTFGHPDFLGLRQPHHDGFTLENPRLSRHDAFVLITGSGVPTVVGYNIDLFDLCGRECMKDMDYCMSKLREQTADEQVLGAVMFSCCGRGPEAGSLIAEEMADVKRFSKVFPNVPCLGFYAAGEIGPLALAGRKSVFQTGKACVQGFTAVFALFIVPKFDLGTSRALDDCKESVDIFIRSRLGGLDGN